MTTDAINRPEILREQLVCPECGECHFDIGEWRDRPHHKHLCHYCGHIWRVEPYTAGDDAIVTEEQSLWAYAHNKGYEAATKAAADEITRLTEEVERLEKQNRGLCEREEMHIQEALDIQAKADALAEALGR